MPMLDAHIPKGALTPQAEANLLERLTDILIRHEGVDPQNEQARSLAWVFVHRPDKVYVAGHEAKAPRYKFVTSVPEGQFDEARRRAMISAVTDAALDAENGAYLRDETRIWVLTPEIPDGIWGYAGTIYGLKEIAGYVFGDAEKGAAYAKRTLKARRAIAAGAAQ